MQAKVTFLGVYSVEKGKSQIRKARDLFFVWQIRDESGRHFHAQQINESFAPTGKIVAIDESTLSFFTFEPAILAMPLATPEEVLASRKTPKDKQTPEEAKQAADEQEAEKAKERMRVAREKERTLRNDFVTALQNLSKPRERNGALRFIKGIPSQEGLEPVHSHMLRDFCTSLRKQSLPEIALSFATKTVELVPSDDHAHFNLARIYFILERYEDAIDELQRAITIGHSLEDDSIYRKMLNCVEQEEKRHISPTKLAMMRAKENAAKQGRAFTY